MRFNLIVQGAMSLFVVGLGLGTANAQVAVTTDKAVKVHAAPSPASKVVSSLPAGDIVILDSTKSRRSYFKVRLEANKTGWVHGLHLLVPDLESIAPGSEIFMRVAGARPICGGAAHYRWAAKTVVSGFTQSPVQVSVTGVLRWAVLPFRGQSILFWCKNRVGREANSYSVLGWVRRTRVETDGDVHIEITQRVADATGDCVVVEIPPADLSGRFARARTDLAALLSLNNLGDKDFDSPVQVRFFGRAFWDGWHATAGLPRGHGRCDSRPGAVWELHPVFKLSAP